MSLKKYLPALLIGVSVFVIVLGAYIFTLFQPVGTNGSSITQFAIPKGQAVSVIADRLRDEGLIKSPLAFRYVLKQKGLEGRLQAGSFQLSPTMSLTKIATLLTQGTNDIWVTIPEGWRREEIAASFNTQDFPEFDSKEFLNFSIGKEGQLFPDTYLFARLSTAETVYKALTNNFEKKIIEGLSKEIIQSDYEIKDALIMASIVERESRGFEEMRHVAGVLWHRIEIGMALQVDATLQYIKGYDNKTQSWWDPPTGAEKSIVSPFNTYLNPGLPPKPISNPGLEAIKAALNSQETNDLYYLHDRAGAIHYAQTLEEHNANVQRYLR